MKRDLEMRSLNNFRPLSGSPVPYEENVHHWIPLRKNTALKFRHHYLIFIISEMCHDMNKQDICYPKLCDIIKV